MRCEVCGEPARNLTGHAGPVLTASTTELKAGECRCVRYTAGVVGGKAALVRVLQDADLPPSMMDLPCEGAA